MKELLKSVENLKIGKTRKLADSRIKEFQKLGKSSGNKLFEDLCFCLLTANYNAEGGIRIQEALGEKFCTLPENELALELKRLGHRYPNARAGYISGARKHIPLLKSLLSKSGPEAREWLVKNVDGLGWKESSHFLRNVGFQDLAIIDFHIVDLLVREGLIERPKVLTKKHYLDIEGLLGKMAEKAGLSLGELDLYLWYLETGKMLK